MNSPLAIRTRIIALFPPLAAVLLLVGEALTPKGLDHPISMSRAAKELPIAEVHLKPAVSLQSACDLRVWALGVSFAAIAVLVRERGSIIATVAAVVGGLAGFCGGLANVLVGYDLAAAAKGHTAASAAEQILVSTRTGAGLRRGVRRLPGGSRDRDRLDDGRTLAKPRRASLAPGSFRSRRRARRAGSRGNRLHPAAATNCRRADCSRDPHLENNDTAGP